MEVWRASKRSHRVSVQTSNSWLGYLFLKNAPKGCPYMRTRKWGKKKGRYVQNWWAWGHSNSWYIRRRNERECRPVAPQFFAPYAQRTPDLRMDIRIDSSSIWKSVRYLSEKTEKTLKREAGDRFSDRFFDRFRLSWIPVYGQEKQGIAGCSCQKTHVLECVICARLKSLRI